MVYPPWMPLVLSLPLSAASFSSLSAAAHPGRAHRLNRPGNAPGTTAATARRRRLGRPVPPAPWRGPLGGIGVRSKRGHLHRRFSSLGSEAASRDDVSDEVDGELLDGRSAPAERRAQAREVARRGSRAREGEAEEEFLRRELAHLDALEQILEELEGSSLLLGDNGEEEEGDEDEEEEDPMRLLNELLESIDEIDVDEDDDISNEDTRESPILDAEPRPPALSPSASSKTPPPAGPFSALESALMQGVVPAGAGVGDDSLPGDFGFDPLQLSKRDLFRPVQSALLRLLPGGGGGSKQGGEAPPKPNADAAPGAIEAPRPPALILRDYREAEIRHGRLAMLAAVVWPLQEMLDRLILEDDLYGPLLSGPVTLPYFPLFMTAVLLLLGYLDIYAAAVKEMDDIGEAYLPGDCFWDPLRILIGTSPDTKRRMQERELFNGRAAMLAFAVFVWEELVTRTPVVDVPGNELLFQPLYQVPLVQAWLDAQFSAAPTTSALLADPDALYMPLE